MKYPKQDVIETDDDNLGNYYYTDEIIKDKDGIEWFVFSTRYEMDMVEDEEGRDIDMGADPIYLYVNVEDENFICDEIQV